MFQLFKIYFKISFVVFILSGCSIDQFTLKKEQKKTYKKTTNCKKYFKIMQYASTYVIEEFEKGYFKDKNFIEARAQLFLIENNSKTPFAININKAQNSYKLQYDLAKKERCDLSSFIVSPLEKVKIKLKVLESSQTKR